MTFSPILTIEPRRRKFHRSIELRLPIPSGFRGTPGDAEQNLRLLCSIEEGVTRAEWKDMTESIRPFHLDGKHLVFSTTISARYWLVHSAKGAQQQQQLRQEAQQLYRLINRVPFMGKFVIFAKRRDINRANLRVYCMTDDKEERSLEIQEHYSQVAKSRQVELIDGQRMFLEFGGNLLPALDTNSSHYHSAKAALINEQLSVVFRALQENRLAFTVQLKELSQEAEGRIAFMEDSIKYLSSLTGQQREYLHQNSRRAVCRLAVQLPQMCIDYQRILGTPRSNSRLASSARIGDLTLAQVASLLDNSSSILSSGDSDSREEDSLDGVRSGNAIDRSWIELAPYLGIPKDEVDYINEHAASQSMSQSLLLLMHWYQLSSEDTRDQDLARALIAIGRDDIAKRFNFPVEPKRMSRSTAELLHEIDLIPVQSHENLHHQDSISNLSYASSRKILGVQQQPKIYVRANTEDHEANQSGLPVSDLKELVFCDQMSPPSKETPVKVGGNLQEGELLESRNIDQDLANLVRAGSPLDGRDLIQDIGQMSECADRIDTLLNNQLESLRSRSSSPMPQSRLEMELDSEQEEEELGDAWNKQSMGEPNRSQSHFRNKVGGFSWPAGGSGGAVDGCARLQTGEPSPCAVLRRSWEARYGSRRSASQLACQRPSERLPGCFEGPLGAQAQPPLAPKFRTSSWGAHGRACLAPQRVSDNESRLDGSAQTLMHLPERSPQPTSANPDLNNAPESSLSKCTHPQLPNPAATGKLNVNVSQPSAGGADVKIEVAAEGLKAAGADLDSGASIQRALQSASPKFKDFWEASCSTQYITTSYSSPNKVSRRAVEAADNLERSDLGSEGELLLGTEHSAASVEFDNNSGSKNLQLISVGFVKTHQQKVASKVTNEQRDRRRKSVVGENLVEGQDRFFELLSSKLSYWRRHSLPGRLEENIEGQVVRWKSCGKLKRDRKSVLVSGSSSVGADNTLTCTANYPPHQSSSYYTTAPLAGTSEEVHISQSSSVAGNLSYSEYQSARSKLSGVGQASNQNQEEEQQEAGAMLSSASRIRPVSRARSVSDTGSATLTPDTEELEEEEEEVGGHELMDPDQHQVEEDYREHQEDSNDFDELRKRLPTGQAMDLDEEQLRRSLTRKRLSEGCIIRCGNGLLNRKNSLHLTEGGGLAQITEGEPMFQSGGDSPCLLAGGVLPIRPQSLMSSKRGGAGSQEESCSSSTSLERSPTRRRSSTVSQCSSVLSEGTRNQLNFDLSPDLPPDSSILKANALDIDLDEMEDPRPSSPEPRSELADSDRYSRPQSCLSSNDEQLIGDRLSPDSFRDSAQNVEYYRGEVFEDGGDWNGPISETGVRKSTGRQSAELLERIISDVNSVAVSSTSIAGGLVSEAVGSKRSADPEVEGNTCTNKIVRSDQSERIRTPSPSPYLKPTSHSMKKNPQQDCKVRPHSSCGSIINEANNQQECKEESEFPNT